jgi:hypothetical protein
MSHEVLALNKSRVMAFALETCKEIEALLVTLPVELDLADGRCAAVQEGIVALLTREETGGAAVIDHFTKTFLKRVWLVLGQSMTEEWKGSGATDRARVAVKAFVAQSAPELTAALASSRRDAAEHALEVRRQGSANPTSEEDSSSPSDAESDAKDRGRHDRRHSLPGRTLSKAQQAHQSGAAKHVREQRSSRRQPALPAGLTSSGSNSLDTVVSLLQQLQVTVQSQSKDIAALQSQRQSPSSALSSSSSSGSDSDYVPSFRLGSRSTGSRATGPAETELARRLGGRRSRRQQQQEETQSTSAMTSSDERTVTVRRSGAGFSRSSLRSHAAPPGGATASVRSLVPFPMEHYRSINDAYAGLEGCVKRWRETAWTKSSLKEEGEVLALAMDALVDGNADTALEVLMRRFEGIIHADSQGGNMGMCRLMAYKPPVHLHMDTITSLARVANVNRQLGKHGDSAQPVPLLDAFGAPSARTKGPSRSAGGSSRRARRRRSNHRSSREGSPTAAGDPAAPTGSRKKSRERSSRSSSSPKTPAAGSNQGRHSKKSSSGGGANG